MWLLAEILFTVNIWCGLCGVLLPLAIGVWGLGWHAILSLIQHLLWIFIVYPTRRETRIHSQTVHGTVPCIFLWQRPCQLLSPPLLVQPNIICCSNDPTTVTILTRSKTHRSCQITLASPNLGLTLQPGPTTAPWLKDGPLPLLQCWWSSLWSWIPWAHHTLLWNSLCLVHQHKTQSPRSYSANYLPSRINPDTLFLPQCPQNFEM